MLKTKKKIAIVYGHNSEKLNTTIEFINNYQNNGYRIKPVVVTSRQLRTEGNFVFKTFIDTFRNIDAAIVFMTADDKGISNKKIQEYSFKTSKELQEKLLPRARQNVIFELGFIIAKVGEGNYRIFADDEIEIPSDIQGKYLEYDLSAKNIELIVKEMVEENLKIHKEEFPIINRNYKLNYAELPNSKENTIKLFKEEYEQLDDDGDRIVYLFERIVFDTYFQSPDWWQEKYRSLTSKNENISLCKKLLEEISRYMNSYLSNNKHDYNSLYTCFTNFNYLLSTIPDHLNPIIKMISLNYFGLTCLKLGTYSAIENPKEMLIKAADAFTNATILAEEHDDPLLPLWSGFILFNQARNYKSLCLLDSSLKTNYNWRKVFSEAIDKRKIWTKNPYQLPTVIQEGLSTEYIYAKLERILCAEVDTQNNITEKFPYAIDEDFIQETKKEYQEWRVDPNQFRVRLSKNVDISWGKIEERFTK
jgi:predicted nucleotide-binding protein